MARLTGNFIGDMTACATAGAMDLEHKTWSEHLINDAGLDINKFPKLLHSHELAGVIAEKGAADTGYLPGTKVYAGTGDAVATTLASGILAPGEYNVNLGTSSWWQLYQKAVWTVKAAVLTWLPCKRLIY